MRSTEFSMKGDAQHTGIPLGLGEVKTMGPRAISPDFAIETYSGNEFLLVPLSDRAKEWTRENIHSPQYIGDGILVPTSRIYSIYTRMTDAGLSDDMDRIHIGEDAA